MSPVGNATTAKPTTAGSKIRPTIPRVTTTTATQQTQRHSQSQPHRLPTAQSSAQCTPHRLHPRPSQAQITILDGIGKTGCPLHTQHTRLVQRQQTAAHSPQRHAPPQTALVRRICQKIKQTGQGGGAIWPLGLNCAATGAINIQHPDQPSRQNPSQGPCRTRGCSQRATPPSAHRQ